MTLRALSWGLVVFFVMYGSACAGEFMTDRADPFSDVPNGHWARTAVEHLRSKGILAGRADGGFDGKATFTRYEMAVVVARYLENTEKMAERMKLGSGDRTTLSKLCDEFRSELDMLGTQFYELARDLRVTKRVLGNVVATTSLNRVGLQDLGDKHGNLEARVAMIEDIVAPAVAKARTQPTAARSAATGGKPAKLSVYEMKLIKNIVRQAIAEERGLASSGGRMGRPLADD